MPRCRSASNKITFTQTGTYEFTVTEGAIDEEHVSNTSGTSVTYRVVVDDTTQDGKLEVGELLRDRPDTGSSAFVNQLQPGRRVRWPDGD